MADNTEWGVRKCDQFLFNRHGCKMPKSLHSRPAHGGSDYDFVILRQNVEKEHSEEVGVVKKMNRRYQ